MRSKLWRLASIGLGAPPDGLGQFRLADRLSRRYDERLVLEQRMHNGTRMALNVGDRMQGTAFLIRRFDAELAEFAISRLSPGGVMLDVGANVGLISFAVAVRRPGARVVAFEPNPDAGDMWERNRRLNNARGELVRAAVGDRVGVGHLAFDAPDDSGSGKLADDGAIPVSITTLDAACAELGVDAVDVVKIDVQGSEPAVLRGAERLLSSRAIGALIIEDNGGEFDALLSPHGYTRVEIPPVGLRRWRRHPPMGDVAYVAH